MFLRGGGGLGRVVVETWVEVATGAAEPRRLSIERVVADEVKVRESLGVAVPLLSDPQVGVRFVEEKYAVVGESLCFAEER
jgi:hypothetical protein